LLKTDVTQKFNSWKSKPYYFGIAQEVMLYQNIGFAEFRWDYFAYGSDASARLCEVWNKPKQSLVGSRISSLHYL
jgi:hypothetical protein